MASRKARPGTRTKRSKQRFTKPMYGVMLVVLVVSLKISVHLGESRQLPNDYEQIDGTLASLHQDVDTVNKLDVLPKLEGSWRTAAAIAELSGVAFTHFETSQDADSSRSYTGPLRHWNAQIEGEPRVVLAVVRSIQFRVPTFLYDYAISAGVMKLNITVVGT